MRYSMLLRKSTFRSVSLSARIYPPCETASANTQQVSFIPMQTIRAITDKKIN